MLNKLNLEDTKLRWRAFWQQELVDRPVVCVTAPKKGADRPKDTCFLRGPGAAGFHACMEGRMEAHIAAFEAFARATYYGGEALPWTQITLGPDEFTGFLGGTISPRDAEYTTWVAPFVNDWSDIDFTLDKREGSYYDCLKKGIETAARISDGRFLLSQMDLHTNLDALSAMRSPQNLCMDLLDSPETVHRALDAVERHFSEVFDMVYEAGDMARNGSIGWAPLYLEQGRFAVLQCDFACMLGPEHAREFVIPCLQREASYLDHCVYHYDGVGALTMLNDLLSIREIDCIQWLPGAGKPRSPEWMELLQKIQAVGKSLWLCDWTIDEIKAHFRELEPNKVVFSVEAESEDEAEELLAYLKSHT